MTNAGAEVVNIAVFNPKLSVATRLCWTFCGSDGGSFVLPSGAVDLFGRGGLALGLHGPLLPIERFVFE